MAVQLENREKLSGIRILHANNDAVVVFSGEAFLKNLPYLVSLYTEFGIRNVGWSPDYARQLALRGLGVDELRENAPLNNQTTAFILKDHNKLRRVPSVMLFRPEDGEPGQYMGFSAQRNYFPMVQRESQRPKEEVPTTYHVFRAFDYDNRGKKRGRLSVELTLFLHPGTKWYLHRTGNYVAAYANTQSTALDQRQSRPWKQLYNKGSFEFKLLKEMYNIVGSHSSADDLEETGVSRNEYHEPNGAIEEPRSGHKGSRRIWDKMYGRDPDEFDMDPLDAVFALYRVA